ncbi:hypothetical protein IWX90DRAFT_253238 [Phyllosticta citrichinensis]|uniref:Uncharacterized protein n=1 Tax=Phyllosticta citrichinensis TaxID=1130410 RepID=A0ABR1XRS6_9PEZI
MHGWTGWTEDWEACARESLSRRTDPGFLLQSLSIDAASVSLPSFLSLLSPLPSSLCQKFHTTIPLGRTRGTRTLSHSRSLTLSLSLCLLSSFLPLLARARQSVSEPVHRPHTCHSHKANLTTQISWQATVPDTRALDIRWDWTGLDGLDMGGNEREELSHFSRFITTRYHHHDDDDDSPALLPTSPSLLARIRSCGRQDDVVRGRTSGRSAEWQADVLLVVNV